MGKKRKLSSTGAKAQRNRRPPPPKKAQPSPRNDAPKPGRPSSSSSSSRPPRPETPPTVPFSPDHAILLVGEGDLSFAAALVEHHGCSRVTATVPERGAEELAAKYPQAGANAARVAGGGGRVVYGVDARRMRPWAGKRTTPGEGGDMDRVVFNFPHVGGRSTDVNRQVRHNQELLAGFFGRALPSLAPGGAVVVTLFEGAPYELWNIRDLARSQGLQVERSFRFRADAYPGYRHARTLGVVKNRRGEEGGGWKGEDRPARSYVFVRKGETSTAVPVSAKKRKRDSDDDDDDSSSSDDE